MSSKRACVLESRLSVEVEPIFLPPVLGVVGERKGRVKNGSKIGVMRKWKDRLTACQLQGNKFSLSCLLDTQVEMPECLLVGQACRHRTHLLGAHSLASVSVTQLPMVSQLLSPNEPQCLPPLLPLTPASKSSLVFSLFPKESPQLTSSYLNSNHPSVISCHSTNIHSEPDSA